MAPNRGWLVLINAQGRRFANETAPYTVLGGLVQRQGGSAYAVFDEASRAAAAPNMLFRAYWVDHADLNDPQVVSSLLGDSGLKTTLIDNLEPQATLSKCQERAEQDGVIDTPAFVVDGQLFIGREHLPWIEELLTATA